MNPLTNMKNVLKLSEHELKSGAKTSWHDMYRDSAWIFVGGFPYTLTEGDIVCVFSQYGEIVNINLIREKSTGKSKGFCFICFEDQRSTILSVDNLNGIKILGRTLRVDHVADYKPPKENEKTDEETIKLYMEGCAPKLQILENKIKVDVDEKTNTPRSSEEVPRKKLKKLKKDRKSNKKSKKSKRSKKSKAPSSHSESNSSSEKMYNSIM